MEKSNVFEFPIYLKYYFKQNEILMELFISCNRRCKIFSSIFLLVKYSKSLLVLFPFFCLETKRQVYFIFHFNSSCKCIFINTSAPWAI